MLIQTEKTPNPNSIKFLPSVDVSPENPINFINKNETKGKSILASKLFDIEGVQTVFFGQNFITITKINEIEWDIIKPEVLMIIMDHFVSGFQALENIISYNSDIENPNLSTIEKEIIELIETRVRPSVAMDGGDIIYKGYKDGIVMLELHGACSTCPSSTITLKNGIESMLKHYIPEIIGVEATN